MQCLEKAFAIRQEIHSVCGGAFEKTCLLPYSRKHQRMLFLLESEGSRDRKHPLPPALPFIEISPVPTAVIYLCWQLRYLDSTSWKVQKQNHSSSMPRRKKTLMCKELWSKMLFRLAIEALEWWEITNLWGLLILLCQF